MSDTISTFALPTGTPDGDFVIRHGKVFECGDYPDKHFSLTPDEAAAAVAAFSPVPNDLEHRPTILSGHLGELTNVSVAEDGTSLMGSVRIPRWLHDAIGDAPLKTSLAWDIPTKRIIKNGLVIEPRVPDAALFTAYAEFAGKRHSQADQDALQAVHDHAVSLGAECQAKMSGGTMDDTKKISIFDTLKALFTGGDFIVPPVAATPPARAEETAEMTDSTDKGQQPDVAALMARIEALESGSANDKATIALMKRDGIAKDAAIFADAEIAAKRALPAEKAILIAAFTDAAEDDAAHPRTVTFSVGTEEKTGTRVDALIARYAARQPHVLTEELLADSDAQALFNKTRSATAKDGEMTAERRKELLSKTALGQTIIAAK